MGFKEMVARDIRKVFLNTDESAELRNIRYEGTLYRDVSVSLQNVSAQTWQRGGNSSAEARISSHAQGLSSASKALYCAVDDIGGVQPKRGERFDIGRSGRFQRFRVRSPSLTAGMLCVELEALTASG